MTIVNFKVGYIICRCEKNALPSYYKITYLTESTYCFLSVQCIRFVMVLFHFKE